MTAVDWYRLVLVEDRSCAVVGCSTGCSGLHFWLIHGTVMAFDWVIPYTELMEWLQVGLSNKSKQSWFKVGLKVVNRRCYLGIKGCKGPCLGTWFKAILDGFWVVLVFFCLRIRHRFRQGEGLNMTDIDGLLWLNFNRVLSSYCWLNN